MHCDLERAAQMSALLSHLLLESLAAESSAASVPATGTLSCRLPLFADREDAASAASAQRRHRYSTRGH
jgi:hypothetical protein